MITANFSILNQLGTPMFYSDVLANRPTAGVVGRLFVSTDTKAWYRDTGSSWDLIGAAGSGTISGTGANGYVSFFTGTNTISGSSDLYWDNTNKWLGIGSIPSAALDIHNSTSVMMRLNNTSTLNTLIVLENQTNVKWRLGNYYSGNTNYFAIFDVVGGTERLKITNAGVGTFTGSLAISGTIGTAITASRAIQTDGSGNLAASAVTSTELGYVSGVTSAIQTQINNKQGIISLTTTGTSGSASLVANTLNIPQYQGALTLTTTGSTGAATLVGNTLNIPDYSTSTGFVPTSRTLTINGTTYDLSADRTWAVGSVTSVGLLTGTTGTDVNVSGSPITGSGSITLNIPTASSTNRGVLSSADWTTFNNKQATVTLTTTGTSGAATFVSNTLNIPQYQGALTLTTSGSSGASTLVGNTLNIPTYTLSGLGGIGGSGTASYVPRFTAASTIGNGIIQDNGSSTGGVGINIAPVSGKIAQIDSLNTTFPSLTLRSGYTGLLANNIALSLYRYDWSSSTDGIGLSFDQTNNSAAQTTYAAIYGYPSTRTAGAEGGLFRIYNKRAGTNTIALEIDESGNTFMNTGVMKLNTSTSFGTADSYIVVNNATAGNTVGFLTATANTLRAYLVSSNSGSTLGAAAQLFFNVNGVNLWNITTNGQLTNLNAPANQWAAIIAGSGTTSQSLGLRVQGGTNSSDTSFQVTNYSASQTQFTVRGDGAATFSSGVGVNGATLQTGLGAGLTIEGGTYAPAYFSNSGTLRGFVSGYSGGLLIQASTGNLILNNSGGNVAIGTTNASGKLTVNTGVNENVNILSGGSGDLRIAALNDAASSTVQLSIQGSPLLFRVAGGAEAMRITSGGNVIIGNAGSAISTRQELRITGNASGSRISLGLNGTNYSALVTDSGGNVYLTNEYNDSAIKLSMINYNNGVYLSQSATSWTSNSDIRLKNIIGNIENAVDSLMTLRTVKFSWKSDSNNKENLGLIAQDVEQVFPEVMDKNKLMNSDDETEYLGVRYQELVPVLVKAIQELNEKIDSLKN